MLDAGRLEANYEHGVLTVQILLAEGAGPRKVAIGQASGLVDALAEAPSA
ncbi:MAG: hypothetical protein ACRDV9_02230 [Acidimicrobiia bacterium]